MTDPLRKPRTLRFQFSRALIVSAPLIGGLACGEPAPAVNTVAPEQEVVETTNVGGRGDDEHPEEEPTVEPRPDDNVNVVESPPEPERPPENTNVTEEGS